MSSPLVLTDPARAAAIPSGLRQCPGLPTALAELFERCLAKNPADRPSTREVATGLVDY